MKIKIVFSTYVYSNFPGNFSYRCDTFVLFSFRWRVPVCRAGEQAVEVRTEELEDLTQPWARRKRPTCTCLLLSGTVLRGQPVAAARRNHTPTLLPSVTTERIRRTSQRTHCPARWSCTPGMKQNELKRGYWLSGCTENAGQVERFSLALAGGGRSVLVWKTHEHI